MIDAEQFVAALDAAGYHDVVGVPCSTLADVHEVLAGHPSVRYHAAPNEGSAAATAMGLWMAGRRSAVLMQNSGLGHLMNPLASVAMPSRIPVVAFMTMRGWPDADNAEAQHSVMGGQSGALIDALGVPRFTMPDTVDAFADSLKRVAEHTDQGESAFVLVTSQALAAPGKRPAPRPGLGMSRRDVVRFAVDTFRDAVFVASIGRISRELFAVADRPDNFYLQGGMGHAISLALGVAMAKPHRPVVVLDGDGSAIMHLGTFSFVGHTAPRNLVHLILDNGVYESTGGQATTAHNTDFRAVAVACGYRTATTATSAADLAAQHNALTGPGPVLAHVRINAESPVAGGRATESVGPVELADRFITALDRD